MSLPKRPPNLSPFPRTRRELELLLAQRQQYEAAHLHRVAWAAANPPKPRGPSLLKSVAVPASPERAAWLCARLPPC